MIINAGQFMIMNTMPHLICTYGESAWSPPPPPHTHTHKGTNEEDLLITRIKTKSEFIGLHATEVKKKKLKKRKKERKEDKAGDSSLD